jgi:hypothetical protein
MTKIPFGVHSTGQLIDATQAKNGAGCDCTCPECGARLIAYQGEVKNPYFGHKGGVDCAGSAMTALHKAAQQLIVERGRLPLPPLRVVAKKMHSKFGPFTEVKDFFEGQEWRLTNACKEVRTSNGRIVDVGGVDPQVGNVAVEVRVTHAVDEEKANDIAASGLPCIEIDLSKLLGQPLTMASLSGHLFCSLDDRYWIYHPQYDECKRVLLEGYPAWVTQEEKKLKARLEFEKVQREELNKRMLREQSEKQARYRAFARNTAQVKDDISTLLGVPYDEWPSPINIPDKDDNQPFFVAGKIWHGVLFEQWLIERRVVNSRPAALPKPIDMAKQIALRLGCFALGYGFNLPEAKHAVAAYMKYLKRAGFVIESHGNVYATGKPFGLMRRNDRRQVTMVNMVEWAEIWPHPQEALEISECFAQAEGWDKFDFYYFVHQLYDCDVEPTLPELRRLMHMCQGPVSCVSKLLDALGMRQASQFQACRGWPKPWDSDYH